MGEVGFRVREAVQAVQDGAEGHRGFLVPEVPVLADRRAARLAQDFTAGPLQLLNEGIEEAVDGGVIEEGDFLPAPQLEKVAVRVPFVPIAPVLVGPSR